MCLHLSNVWYDNPHFSAYSRQTQQPPDRFAASHPEGITSKTNEVHMGEEGQFPLVRIVGTSSIYQAGHGCNLGQDSSRMMAFLTKRHRLHKSGSSPGSIPRNPRADSPIA
ncbi:Cytochrome P450 monooxygenase lolP1 [Fusarium oxysporum f. sp. albedinis]|nr:Cytochrome P450 monooxygenase lolP1 [Fusarium oxysporum f. sp. albedinis]